MLRLYLESWKKYATMDGRATRTEFFGFTFITMGLLYAFAKIHDVTVGSYDGSVLMIVFFVLSIIPGITVAIRRLHDSDRSGAWYFLSAIPFIGALLFLILMLLPGTHGANTYGYDPRQKENPYIE